MKLHTNCITNFKRLEQLKNAVASVDKKYTVAASYASTPGHTPVIQQLENWYQTEEDFGCNRLWMQSIAMARTKYICVHHDDDLRPSGFDTAAEEIAQRLEQTGAGFAAWDGIQDFNGQTGKIISVARRESGVQKSTKLTHHVLKRGALPWSPVSFMLQRDTALDILSWCDTNLRECVTRPTMMIGNDTSLVLGHIQRFDSFLKVPKPLTRYGHWDGSETCQFAAGKNDELLRAYDKAKDILSGAVIGERKTHPLFIHVTTHGDSGPGRVRSLQCRRGVMRTNKSKPTSLLCRITRRS